jgi:hypothetical protein
MDGKQVVTLQSAILIILGATYHSSSFYYIVWEWFPFHIGYYLFALGVLQLLKAGSKRDDDMEPWYAVQAFFLLWVAFWFFEPAREILGNLEGISPTLAINLWGWKSWGYCLVIFGSVQLIKIRGAKSIKLSLPQALLLIFWGIGFFEWGIFAREFLPPFEYYNYFLALGIMEFLKTIDMDTDSISIGRTESSYGSLNSSKSILDKRTAPMFAPENELTNIECPGCSARMEVAKLGMMQKVTCDECGLSGEIEV